LSRGNRSRPAHERTAEERERDRLERERRRTDGATPEPAAAESASPAPLETEPDAPLEQFESVEPLEPVELGGAGLAGHAFLDPPLPQPEHVEPEPAAPVDAEPVESQAIVEPPSAPEPIEPETAAAPRASQAPPRGRTARFSRDGAGYGRAAGGRGPGGRGRARHGSAGRGGGRRLTRARVAALLALAAAVVLVWFLLSLFQPFAGGGSGRVIVQIPKGSSSSKIGSILAHDDVVSSGFFFNLRALLEGKRSSLHSGRFQLEHGMSYSAAIEALSKPPPKVIAVKVVIPEGYTRRQIADLVGEDALTGDYLAETKHSHVFDPRHYGAPADTPSLEGFLFPATYELTAGAPVQRLVNEQLVAFRERFTAADTRRARELHVTPYQLLTVASMVEREAQTEHDRPLIAAVIYNRLREGIPLGIDASIYYAVELQKGIATYTGELTESQLKIDSPYNTRTHKGLPPTPISNPGDASIQAAAHPAHVSYLYYVAGADGCGEQVFSNSYAEFEKHVAAYDTAVKANGGHPPACKKKR
jgi:peptidoglycan lytic transglycosylase G